MPEYKVLVYPEVLMELLVEADDVEAAREKAYALLTGVTLPRLVEEYSACTDLLLDEDTVDRAEWVDTNGVEHTFWYKEGFDESRG